MTAKLNDIDLQWRAYAQMGRLAPFSPCPVTARRRKLGTYLRLLRQSGQFRQPGALEKLTFEIFRQRKFNALEGLQPRE